VRERSVPWLSLSAVLHGVRPQASVASSPVEFDVVTRVEPSPEQKVVSAAVVALPSPSDTQVGVEQTGRSLAAASSTVDSTRAGSPRPASIAPRRERATRDTPTLPEPAAAQVVPKVETTPVPLGEPGVGDARPSPAWTTLDPRAAALSVVDPREQAPAPSAADKLNQAIARGAVRPNDRPPDPVLQQGPRGGYVFSGHGFTATISPSGDVDMTDRYGTVRIPLVPYQTPTGEWRIGILGGSFHLFEWLDRKFGKNDPYQSERRWFLDRTRALRERLAREHAPRGVVPGRNEAQ